ncbi:MAG: hypothetical protein JXA99_14205 [Candidatus Lokiarchaeota archaeon]|nr:hypothetical protein [Candidatus Lokiarchaeota archaeon]
MIKGIITFSFNLNQKETGEIEPEFRPIQSQFLAEDVDENYYKQLVVENDIFAMYYQHTTGLSGVSVEHSNFFNGRLKETPYQIMSYFKQVSDGSQYLTFSIFELDDEIEIYNDIIKDMGYRLGDIFEKFSEARKAKQLELITNLQIRLKNELKYSIFQIERLSNLTNLQKIALIYNNELRLYILEVLRKFPISSTELRREIQQIKPDANLDILLHPFIELNLVRRDWIEGERNKETGIIKNQGEYLFLVKDVMFARVPNEKLLNHLKETKNELYDIYNREVIKYFTKYDPFEESTKNTQKIASMFLNPDIYDFFVLMRNNFYAKDKIPKIFSEFAVTDVLINDLKEIEVLTEISDNDDRKWLLLLTDIKPMVIFPEFMLPKIRAFYKQNSNKGKLQYQIAKKAYDLLELTYPEKMEF